MDLFLSHQTELISWKASNEQENNLFQLQILGFDWDVCCGVSDP